MEMGIIMNEEGINFDWLREFVGLLPKAKEVRKNFIEIAGYPSWENVNSNLLAFYFDAEEEHNFSRLFIESLLDAIEDSTNDSFDRKLFDTEFSVEREVSTEKGRIDILLQEKLEEDDENEDEEGKSEPQWAIIIENKLFSGLHNDLYDYWNSLKESKKIGVVLSIHKIEIPEKYKDKDGIIFENVTHKELILKIQKHLPDYFFESDDRHLLFLKEYIANIKSHYEDKEESTKMDEILQKFHEYSEEINTLKTKEKKLLAYLYQSVSHVFAEFGFEPKPPSSKRKSHHFHAKKDNADPIVEFDNEIIGRFRFFVHTSGLRYNNMFCTYFELFNKENTRYGDYLIKKLKNRKIETDIVEIGSGGRSGGGHQHIYTIKFTMEDFTKKGFVNQLREKLKNHFFEHKNEFVKIAVNDLRAIVDSNRT